MVNELLIGRLGEHGLFPEASQIAIGLKDGNKGGLGKVDQMAVQLLAKVYRPLAAAFWGQELRQCPCHRKQG
jgi:hypothetical protein